MAQMLVRNLDDEVVAMIKAQAKSKKRSAEAEVRDILSAAVAAKSGKRKSISNLIGSGRPGRTQKEIDAYVRRLRDEWAA